METDHELEEMSDGFELRYVYHQDLFVDLAEFVTLEHLCCPFLSFALSLGPARTIHLRLYGSPDIKAFVGAEFGLTARRR